MNIIKLDAIESTNDYLKSSKINDTQIVYTYNQTKGKGQRGNNWLSEPGKNVAFSIKLLPNNFQIKDQFRINIIFSIFLVNSLKALKIPDIKIKWPNDIMSGNKKICGILNELKVKGNYIQEIVVGFGLNVNQENFNNLPNASSLKLITSLNFRLDEIVSLLIQNLKRYNYLEKLFTIESDFIDLYNCNLYGLNSVFEFENGKTRFKGEIISVSKEGSLKIKKKCGTVNSYNVHEVKLIY